MPPDRPSYSGSGIAAGYPALFQKKIPLDGSVIIRAMLAWVSSCSALASEAAPIYVVNSSSGAFRLVNGDSDAELYETARLRLVLADKQHAQDQSTGLQRMLSPRHLYRLGHLLSGFKYAIPGSLIEPSSDSKHYQLHFLPNEFITGRLGLQLSGSAYQLLENDLAALATTMIHLQERGAGGTWKTRHSYPLVQRLETGRVHAESGRLISTGSRRRQFWNIELGQPLVAMLSSGSNELTVAMPSAWRAAGKNRTAQWLSLFAESHGYDGRVVFDHNVGTLLQRTRLTQATASTLVDKITRRASRMPTSSDTSSTTDMFAPSAPKIGHSTGSLLEAVKQHGQQLRSGVRRITTAIRRLSNGGMYHHCEVVPNAANATRSTRQHVTTALFDKFRLTHWPAVLQQALQSLSLPIRKTVSRSLALFPAPSLATQSPSLAPFISAQQPLFQLILTLRRRFQLLTIYRLSAS